MMTKHVGAGMLVGLALVAGCSPMPHDSGSVGLTSGTARILPPVPVVEQVAKGQAARDWAGDAVPSPPLPPPPAEQKSLSTFEFGGAGWTETYYPPPPAEQKSLSTVPEAVGVRVAAGPAPEAAPPSSVVRASSGRAPAWGSPEVVLPGVDPGTGHGAAHASGPPAAKDTPEAA